MSVVVETGRPGDPDPDVLAIGLINNMPDAALETTEQQFINLLDAAAGPRRVCLRFFALPGVPRRDAGRQRIQRAYSAITELWNSRLDGLIVTGTEPCAEDLRDEPYWSSLIQVLNWTQDNSISTVWSCLVAHAIALELSGIRRQRAVEKCSGVFLCTKVATHRLTYGIPERFLVPHSRFNGLCEGELRSAGFVILANSPYAGVDMFAKDGKGLFLFLQGHPEYEAGTLLQEYRRDIRRFMRGETETYPSMPRDYFDAASAAYFGWLREQALRDRSEDAFARLWAGCPQPVLSNTWRSSAVRLYRNWLSLLAMRKGARPAPGRTVELGDGDRESIQVRQH